MNSIYVFGDSHSIIFAYTRDINEHWLGMNNLPVTLNRIGNEGLNLHKTPLILGNGHEKHVPKNGDIIMYSYGSNDAHKGILEQIQKGREKEEIINSLVDSYFKVILHNEKEYNVKSVVYGILPNSDKNVKYNGKHRIIKDIINNLNCKFEKMCKKLLIPYFNINNIVSKKNGYLSEKFSNDLVHIDKSYAQLIRQKLLSFVNKLNIVLITSVCRTKDKPLSYCATRSIFTHQERYEQLIKTIESVKQNIPYAYIILSEYSEFDVHQERNLKEKCDVVLNPDKTELLDTLYFGVFKAIGELTGTRLGLDYIKDTKIQFNNLFKISGRYYCNENFDYNYYNNNKHNFYKINNDINNINTTLYKVPFEYFNGFYKFIKKSDNVHKIFTTGIGYENFISNYVKENNNNTIFLENLGISGKVSVCGSYFNK